MHKVFVSHFLLFQFEHVWLNTVWVFLTHIPTCRPSDWMSSPQSTRPHNFNGLQTIILKWASSTSLNEALEMFFKRQITPELKADLWNPNTMTFKSSFSNDQSTPCVNIILLESSLLFVIIQYQLIVCTANALCYYFAALPFTKPPDITDCATIDAEITKNIIWKVNGV